MTASNFVSIGELWEEERALCGADPWPYGFAGNERVLETLVRYATEQGIVKEKVAVSSLLHGVGES